MKAKGKGPRSARSYEYDVCLSFAGEDRGYVRDVAEALRSHGVRVFFDEYAQASLWGKDLYAHLDDVYQNAARYCVLFASRHYAQKVWPNHERESAQARAVRENREYILPARFDSTEIPGVRSTVGYVDLRAFRPKQLAKLLLEKLGNRQTNDYFPPNPDRLFRHLKVRSEKAKGRVEGRARNFYKALQRMNQEERLVVFALFLESCPTELPKNVHINIDLLHRVTGFPATKILRLLSGIRSLGFLASLRDGDHDHLLAVTEKMVVMEWNDRSMDPELRGNATGEAAAVVDVAISGFCEECGPGHLLRLDLSQLSSATHEVDTHISTTPHNQALQTDERRATVNPKLKGNSRAARG